MLFHLWVGMEGTLQGQKSPNEMHHHRSLHVNERPPPPLGSCLKTKCVHAAAVTFLEKFEKLSSISSPPPQIFWTVGDVNERRGERGLFFPSCFFFRARTHATPGRPTLKAPPSFSCEVASLFEENFHENRFGEHGCISWTYATCR